MIDHSDVAHRHYCEPPDIIQRDATLPWPSLVVRHPEGTRFVCDDCGAGQVVAWRPDQVYGSTVWVGGLAWRPETRRERRRRLRRQRADARPVAPPR